MLAYLEDTSLDTKDLFAPKVVYAVASDTADHHTDLCSKSSLHAI